MSGPVKVVVLSQPRTGSTLLCSLLSSAPGVRVLVEPINPATHRHHMKPLASSHCLLPESMIQSNIGRALDILFDPNPPPEQWIRNRKRGDKVVGFKIMAHQLRGLRNESQVWERLSAERIKVILCFRHNIIMQYVSDLISMATSQPTCWDGNIKTAKVKVDIKVLGTELNKIMEEKHYLIDKVNEFSLEHRRVRYEALKDDVLPAENLLHWLVNERYSLTTKLSKQNPDSLRDRVTNYDELAQEIKRLGLGHLLINT